MTQSSNGPKPEDSQGGGAKVGRILQQARMAAHIEVNKVCADLRISPQALEAIEQGNYHLLPGDPYIRALLGSMSRYLGLDPLAVVKEYNKEIGAAPQEPSVAPYADKAHTYSTAHKQIFIVIVLALFVVLFLLIGRLNRGESVPAAPPVGSMAPVESPAAAAGDNGFESKSLAPDSAAADTSRDSAAVRRGSAPAVPAPGAAAPSPAPVPGTAPAAPATPAAQAPGPAGDTAGMNVAVIKPIIDSVGIRVVRSGKEDFAALLRYGKQMQVSHPDTITVYTTKSRTVEVTAGGRTVVPTRKRFKIHGNTVKVF